MARLRSHTRQPTDANQVSDNVLPPLVPAAKSRSRCFNIFWAWTILSSNFCTFKLPERRAKNAIWRTAMGTNTMPKKKKARKAGQQLGHLKCDERTLEAALESGAGRILILLQQTARAFVCSHGGSAVSVQYSSIISPCFVCVFVRCRSDLSALAVLYAHHGGSGEEGVKHVLSRTVLDPLLRGSSRILIFSEGQDTQQLLVSPYYPFAILRTASSFRRRDWTYTKTNTVTDVESDRVVERRRSDRAPSVRDSVTRHTGPLFDFTIVTRRHPRLSFRRRRSSTKIFSSLSRKYASRMPPQVAGSRTGYMYVQVRLADPIGEPHEHTSTPDCFRRRIYRSSLRSVPLCKNNRRSHAHTESLIVF